MDSIPVWKDLLFSILVFMYVFMFKIVGIIDSAIAVGAILAILILFDKRAQKVIFNVLCSKTFAQLLLIFLGLCAWLVLVMSVNQVFDFSFYKTWVHVLVQVIIGIMLYGYLYSHSVHKHITNYLILAFLYQTVIEWLAFISPSVKSLIYLTKDASTIEIADRYSGIRGLSLAGSSFFGLAVAFGLEYILYFSDNATLFKRHPKCRVVAFFFLLTGTFFAGRTGLIGAALVLLYLLYRIVFKHEKMSLKTVAIPVGILIGLFVAFYYISFTFADASTFFEGIRNLYNYVFEALFSALRGNGLTTTSSSELFNEMYFSISLKTFLIGDGYYTDPITGAYYMATDVGYMRVILCGGLPALILLIMFQKKIFDFGKNHKSKLMLVVWAFLFIAQAKGEVIGWSLILLSMCVLYSLQFYKSTEKSVCAQCSPISAIYRRGVKKC